MTFEAAIKGTKAPKEVTNQLKLIKVGFIDFNGREQTGYLVVNKKLAEETKTIFKRLRESKFPIERIELAQHFEWEDKSIMRVNVTSCFNYRLITGTHQLSNHSVGRAIDINPYLNPYYGRKGVEPKGAHYDPKISGTITADSDTVKIFKSYGWKWLGERQEHTDYMHFEKPNE